MQTIRVMRIVIGAVLMALSSRTPVTAQTATSTNVGTSRIFIDGAALADYDQTDFEPAGPAMAGGVGIGARLFTRYSLRFELDVPGKHVDLFEGRGLRHRFESTTTSYAFLLGRHFRMDKRVPIVALIGVSALTHKTHFTGFIDFAPPDVNGSPHVDFNDHDVEQWVALTIGFETPIAVTRHLRLVPQFRSHHVANAELGQLFPSGKSALRPRLSLRWQF
jgi:hypothetical protein